MFELSIETKISTAISIEVFILIIINIVLLILQDKEMKKENEKCKELGWLGDDKK